MAAKLTPLFIIMSLLLCVTTALCETDSESSEESPAVITMEQLNSQLEAMQEEINRLREEADVRNKLKATVEEETEHEKEILSAAGQDYSLSREGSLGIYYNFIYGYNSTDILENIVDPAVDHSSNHNLTNSVSFKYAFRNNVTLSGAVPFIYKSDQRSSSNERNATDIGDLTFGGMWQPTKSDGSRPTIIYNTSIVFPSGTSPYKIDVDEALSTGSGFYSVALGASISKSYDPIFAFGSASVYYPFDATGLSQRRGDGVLTKVEPGKSIGLSGGLAYALSYKVSVNTSISYSYSSKYNYSWQDGSESSSGSSTTAVLNVGTGWRISPRRTISTTLGIGLTNSASDFTFSFSIPFDYKL